MKGLYKRINGKTGKPCRNDDPDRVDYILLSYHRDQIKNLSRTIDELENKVSMLETDRDAWQSKYYMLRRMAEEGGNQ
jgi:hypothetical protein